MSSPADLHVKTDLEVLKDDISLKNDDSSNSDRGKIFDDDDSLFSANTIDSAEDQHITCNLGPQASVSNTQNWPTTLAKNDQEPQKSPDILHPAPSSKNIPHPSKYEHGDYQIDDIHPSLPPLPPVQTDGTPNPYWCPHNHLGLNPTTNPTSKLPSADSIPPINFKSTDTQQSTTEKYIISPIEPSHIHNYWVGRDILTHNIHK